MNEPPETNMLAASARPRRRGRRSLLALAAAAAASTPLPSHAFLTPPSPFRGPTTPRHMIGNVFGGNDEKDPQLPKDIRDAISKCRGAVQAGLQDKLSRMDVEMPVGANFGVENKKESRNKRGNLSSLTGGDATEGLTLDKLETSNRELARLFVEMFQPLGGPAIAAVFNDEALAGEARRRWSGDLGAECRVLAIDRKGKRAPGPGGKKQKKKARGFAAKMAAEFDEDASGPFALPAGTEVALFVAPGPRELLAIERVCETAGEGTAVILLNARLSTIDQYASDEARALFASFEPVWALTAAPRATAPGCLVHRAYPGPWVLARKPAVGPPKTIARKEGAQFTDEECAEEYGKIEVSGMEKGTEKLAENVASWFK